MGVRFLMQYADKIAPDHEATSGLWGHLTALVIVILVFEAISLWRSAGRAGQGSPGAARLLRRGGERDSNSRQ